MSFAVFDARSLANDLQHAVGESYFYDYMREIVNSKLYEKYKDAINGEVKQFAGLIDFMQHKDGLAVKDLSLLEKCLSAIASSSHAMSSDAQWLLGQMSAAQPLAEHRRPTLQEVTDKGSNTTFTRQDRGQAYLLRRIARDQPDLLSEIGQNKRFKSARAAAIEAGIITPFPSLQLKDPAPTAQKLLDKKGHAWCLALLDELSELVFGD
jgi:hypothetical protein